MSIRTRLILKDWFTTGKYPTETQFSEFMDSYFHLSEDALGMDKVTGLIEALAGKASVESVASEPATLTDGSTDALNIGSITTDVNIKVMLFVTRNNLAYSQTLDFVYDGTSLHLSPGEINPYIEGSPTLGITWGKNLNGTDIELTYSLTEGLGDATLRIKTQKI